MGRGILDFIESNGQDGSRQSMSCDVIDEFISREVGSPVT